MLGPVWNRLGRWWLSRPSMVHRMERLSYTHKSSVFGCNYSVLRVFSH